MKLTKSKDGCHTVSMLVSSFRTLIAEVGGFWGILGGCQVDFFGPS